MMIEKTALLDLLKRATSSDSTIRLPAEESLIKLETVPGYLSNLLAISLDNDVNFNSSHVRLLSVLIFKRTISSFWKRGGEIPGNEEKTFIRKQLMFALSNSDETIVRNINISTSLIVRTDFPFDWPSFFQDLLSNLGTLYSRNLFFNSIQSINSLDCLYRGTKVMCTRRLARDRQLFYDIGPSILNCTMNVYTDAIKLIKEEIKPIYISLRLVRISLKTMQICSLFGLEDMTKFPELLNLLVKLPSDVKYLLSIYEATEDPNKTPLEKIILRYGKFFLEILTRIPEIFSLIDPDNSIVAFYWNFARIHEPLHFETLKDKITLQSLRLMKLFIQNKDIFNGNQTMSRASESFNGFIGEQKNPLFNNNFIEEVTKIIVFKYLCLNEEDLEMWQNEPELFLKEEESDHWEFNKRLCSEKILYDLAIRYEDIIIPMLGRMFNDVSSPIMNKVIDGKPDFMELICYKDAVSYSIGLLADIISKTMDINLIISPILEEAKVRSLNFAILRRRAAWIISRFDYTALDLTTKRKIYEILVLLCSVEEDKIVFLTTVRTLNIILDDYYLGLTDIKEYIPSFINNILGNIFNLEESDFVISSINCLSVIVDIYKENIRIYVENIVTTVSKIWADAGEEYILRSSILNLLGKLLKALRNDSYLLHTHLVPMLIFCCDRNNPSSVYLIEDAIELILILVSNSDRFTPEVRTILDILPSLLRTQMDESFQLVLHIYSAMFLLAPQVSLSLSFDTKYDLSFCHQLRTMLDNIKADQASAIFSCLNSAIDASLGCGLSKLVLHSFADTGILDVIIREIYNSTELGTILCHYYYLFFKIIVADPELYYNSIKKYSQNNSIGFDELNFILLLHIIRKEDILYLPEHRLMLLYFLLEILNIYNPVLYQSTIIESSDFCIAKESINLAESIIQNFNNLVRQFSIDTSDTTYYYDDEESLNSKRKQDLQQVTLHYRSLSNVYGSAAEYQKKHILTRLNTVLKNHLLNQHFSSFIPMYAKLLNTVENYKYL